MELDWSLPYNLKIWARFMEMTYNSPATSHLLVLESHQPIIHYIGGSKMVSSLNYWKRCFGKQYKQKNSYIWHVYHIVFFFAGQLSRTSSQDSGILTLAQVSSRDSGIYDCVAKNWDGREILYESVQVSVDEFEALPTAVITPERWIFFDAYSTIYKIE